jgi:hypothetical protein
MFDSPLHYCPHCKDYVALDEGLDECMRLHHCARDTCPIAHLFVEPQRFFIEERNRPAVQAFEAQFGKKA